MEGLKVSDVAKKKKTGLQFRHTMQVLNWLVSGNIQMIFTKLLRYELGESSPVSTIKKTNVIQTCVT